MPISLVSYRIVFMLGSAVHVFKSDKFPSLNIHQLCSILLLPGDYETPLKDRFGIFQPDDQVKTLNEEEFLDTWNSAGTDGTDV